MRTTWGLTGPAFLAIFVLAVLVLLVLAVAVRCWPQPSPSYPVRLTDEELGFLVGGAPRTVLVAVGDLRRHGLIEAAPQRRLQVAVGAAGRSPLQHAVLEAALAGTSGPDLVKNPGVLRAIIELRMSLARRGLLNSPSRQTKLMVLVGALWVVWLVGLVRVVHGAVVGAPIAYLTVLEVAVLAVLVRAGRPLLQQRPRSTRKLVQEIRRARIDPGPDENAEHLFGDRVVLAGVAGVPLALTGAGVLMMMDPTLASALAAQRMSMAGWGGGGSGDLGGGFSSFDSSSSGSSCGSSSGDSSSSSCGGGCGGGCGSS